MTQQEYEIRKKILKEVLEDLKTYRIDVAKTNTFGDNTKFITYGIDMAIDRVDYHYKAEPMVLAHCVETR